MLSFILVSALSPSFAADAPEATVDSSSFELLDYDRSGSTFALTTNATVVDGKTEYDVTIEQTCEVGDAELYCEGEAATAKWSSGFVYQTTPDASTAKVLDAYLDDDEALTLKLIWPDVPQVGSESYASYCGALAADLEDIEFNIAAAAGEYAKCMKGGQIQLGGSWMKTSSWQGQDTGGSATGTCDAQMDALSDWLNLRNETLAAWNQADCSNPDSPGWGTVND